MVQAIYSLMSRTLWGTHSDTLKPMDSEEIVKDASTCLLIENMCNLQAPAYYEKGFGSIRNIS